jgi:hypothetical protein
LSSACALSPVPFPLRADYDQVRSISLAGQNFFYEIRPAETIAILPALPLDYVKQFIAPVLPANRVQRFLDPTLR